MDTQLDTAQRRALEQSALATEEILYAINQLAYPSATIKRVVSRVIQQTRRAALEEASKVVKARTITDVEGDWDRGHNMAVQNIAAALDRLREGVGK